MKTKLTTMLFDMDGTLTDARKEITPEVVKSLTEIQNGTVKHLVTGSDMSKIEEPLIIIPLERPIGQEILKLLFEKPFQKV